MSYKTILEQNNETLRANNQEIENLINEIDFSIGGDTSAFITVDLDNANPSDEVIVNGFTLSELMLAIYPVGSFYISAVSADPGTLFGGTWKRHEDRFLLGASNSYANGSTGGEAAHNNMPPYLAVYMWERIA